MNIVHDAHRFSNMFFRKFVTKTVYGAWTFIKIEQEILSSFPMLFCAAIFIQLRAVLRTAFSSNTVIRLIIII